MFSVREELNLRSKFRLTSVALAQISLRIVRSSSVSANPSMLLPTFVFKDRGQTGKAWEPSRKATIFWIAAWNSINFHFSVFTVTVVHCGILTGAGTLNYTQCCQKRK